MRPRRDDPALETVDELADVLRPPRPVRTDASHFLAYLPSYDFDDDERAAVAFWLASWLVDAEITVEEIAAVLELDADEIEATKDELWERRSEWAQEGPDRGKVR